MTDEAPVFIVGMPRSGTTLMRAALVTHPDIAIAPETHFLNHWVPRFGEPELQSVHDYERFWRLFRDSRQFRALGVTEAAVRERLARLDAPSFRDLFEALLRLHAEAQGRCIWGEKTPGHFAHLDRLLHWFPRARVIFMLRDPRAVVASLMDVPWAAPQLELHAGRWRESARILGRWRHDPRVHAVHYEELVTTPEATLRSAFAFLGVADPYIGGGGAAAGVFTEVVQDDWHREHLARARGPIRTHRLTRWRERLSAAEIATVEYLTRKGMRRHGYDMVTPGPGAVAWGILMLRRLTDRLGRLAPTARRRPRAAKGAAPGERPGSR